jgi:hypothetical protein
MAHIAKLTCIKLYGVKKHKIVNKSLIEEVSMIKSRKIKEIKNRIKKDYKM